MPRPLEKPPEGYRDPSEFPDADKTAGLKEMREGHAALEFAVKESKAKETILREKPAPPDSPLGRAQEKLRIEKIADPLFNDVAAASVEKLPALLQTKLREAFAAGNGKDFLAAVKESMDRFNSIAGVITDGKRIKVKEGMMGMAIKAGALEQFLQAAPADIENDVFASATPPEGLKELDKKHPPLYRKGDVIASAPPPKETREAGPPPEPLPGGVKIRKGMGVSIE
ncbi:hypothetical protein A3H75_03020 [Candidatus Uhrbacteria bacterium RIFCSPLOWO2_02_FULL_51_9]|uniref:Uncharacterized protein n=1 Tax=Candidatus Uhrbacteria bacterium RIFCSPLOWO2_02_FULL_51_9 TaxID=1802410 RepID=A0A1F7VEQ6_9BACT|nr:MAG: hypothetical protein A3H75_03020 [Candidatus Uhrbacteria bacterium RIFCSPLOWO2_02_FULL_51_9]